MRKFVPYSGILNYHTSMMTFSEKSNHIFWNATQDYHKHDDVDAPMINPFPENTIEYDLYHKNWIDAVQWHLEDIVRDPEIDPVKALAIKRRIDSYFLGKYADVKPLPDAVINTESPAWAIDRLSILALKIYHMQQEVERRDASPDHIERCRAKLGVLLEQRTDLSSAIDQLLDDIEQGRRYMKVYRQMKMYNDPSLNPVLYNQK